MTKARIAINGLGRIGRLVLRAIYETGRNDLELVAVNGPAATDAHAHLIQYDSVHGRFNREVGVDGEHLVIDGARIPVFHERDPLKMDWKSVGADIVLECTGKFTKRDGAAQHLQSGARRVLISAPANDADATVVYGVNHAILNPEHTVISVGSCTTNGLAPLAKVLNDAVGIESGFMTTIHAYTGDQNIHDGSHKDMRRARAATLSMVPTSTGAAKALGLVIPELKGKLDGVAIRVPTPNVSLVDLTFQAGRDTSADAINAALKAAANGPLKGVLAVNEAPLVSIDFNHHPASSVADLTQTQLVGPRLARVAAWYDNEWAFSLRMLDVAALAHRLG